MDNGLFCCTCNKLVSPNYHVTWAALCKHANHEVRLYGDLMSLALTNDSDRDLTVKSCRIYPDRGVITFKIETKMNKSTTHWLRTIGGISVFASIGIIQRIWVLPGVDGWRVCASIVIPIIGWVVAHRLTKPVPYSFFKGE